MSEPQPVWTEDDPEHPPWLTHGDVMSVRQQLEEAVELAAKLEQGVLNASKEIIQLRTELAVARETLALADEFVKWVSDNYPKAIREMPTTLYIQMREISAALRSLEATRPDVQTPHDAEWLESSPGVC